ncbi:MULTISPECIES: helix-turn-helix transcriptional regulator [unclassified Variovorax]|uniref:helix-turn-helix domain-containing protein n=1 Tax=unclassified Variovorax TaxID=663243 RepID=UPI000F7F96EB|nr:MULTISPECIES: helix-turn-helix transcriptional regulator [unclassified Variovorax]RSZ38213.1 XRE family transcriptional regulator [Variovorax sp. 553]RSZ39336.1 XRE family transcriptional regulator [Variovorax sp. 679]
MSPFSSHLQALRTRRQMKQSELAGLIGCDQSYISALENGHKGPPPSIFIERLVSTLRLSQAEQAQLHWAFKASGRKLEIAADAPQDLFILVDTLRDKLPRLGPAAVQALLIALNKSDQLPEKSDRPARRLRRRQSEEATMQ